MLGLLFIPLYYAGMEDLPAALSAIAYNWQLPVGLVSTPIEIVTGPTIATIVFRWQLPIAFTGMRIETFRSIL